MLFFGVPIQCTDFVLVLLRILWSTIARDNRTPKSEERGSGRIEHADRP